MLAMPRPWMPFWGRARACPTDRRPLDQQYNPNDPYVRRCGQMTIHAPLRGSTWRSGRACEWYRGTPSGKPPHNDRKKPG
jgi:hypothetical protein